MRKTHCIYYQTQGKCRFPHIASEQLIMSLSMEGSRSFCNKLCDYWTRKRSLKGMKKGCSPKFAKDLKKSLRNSKRDFFWSEIWQRDEINCFNVSRRCGHSIIGQEETSYSVQMFSARGIARPLDMSVSKVHAIFSNILRCYLYKITHVQKLLLADLPVRHKFVLEFLSRLEVDNDWAWNILWTNEAHFYLLRFVNTQICEMHINGIGYYRTIVFRGVLRDPLSVLSMVKVITVFCGIKLFYQFKSVHVLIDLFLCKMALFCTLQS